MDPRSPANRGWDPHPHPRTNRGWGRGWGSGVPCPGREVGPSGLRVGARSLAGTFNLNSRRRPPRSLLVGPRESQGNLGYPHGSDGTVTDPEIPDARRGIGGDSPDPGQIRIIPRFQVPRDPGRIRIGAKSQFFSRSRPNRLFSRPNASDSDGPGAPGLGDTGGLGFGGLPAPLDSPPWPY
jgi:hypothetical protein